MSATILIDGNGVGNAFHHANVLTVGQFQTQAIFGVVKMLRDIVEAYPVHDVLNLWDGQAEHRLAIYSGYKANREEALKDPEKLVKKQAYRAQVPIIQKAISLLGMKQMVCGNLEADDLAGYFSQKLSAAGQNVLLVTGDTDWLQLVNERVVWVDPRGEGRRVNMSNFLDYTGYFTPIAYLQGKALRGDTSDDIPPAGGIGKDGAQELLARFGTVEKFWEQCDSGVYVPKTKAEHRLWKGTSEFSKDQWTAQFTGDPADKKALKKHMDAWPGDTRRNFERNVKLIDLINAPRPEPAKCSIKQPNYNEEVFKALCERLAFFSILKDFDNWIAPFRKRQQQPKAA